MTDIEYIKKYSNPKDLENNLKRLKNGEAVQYIIGNVDFYGNIIKVNHDVLIPRFETEELLEKSINYINKYFKNPKILDIGTGSGCIAITLKKEIPNSIVDASDISLKALKIAKENTLNNKVDINLIQSNIFENINKKYDVLISNPPYIDINDTEIMDIVKNNEPHSALYAPNKGLFFYKEILKNSKNYLNEKSFIAFEIGYKQAYEIKEIVLKYYPNSNIVIEKDLSNKDRFIFIFNNCE